MNIEWDGIYAQTSGYDEEPRFTAHPCAKCGAAGTDCMVMPQGDHRMGDCLYVHSKCVGAFLREHEAGKRIAADPEAPITVWDYQSNRIVPFVRR